MKVHWQFPPMQRKGSPLLQALAGVVGIGILVTVGLFALGAAVVIVVGLVIALAIRRLLSPASPNAASPNQPDARIHTPARGDVINGEFVVVETNPARASRTD